MIEKPAEMEFAAEYEGGFRETMARLTRRAQKPCTDPTDIPPEDMEIVLKHLFVGGYVDTAFRLIGVSGERVYTWLDRAHTDNEAGVESRYTALSRTIKGAQAAAEHRLLSFLASKDTKTFWQQWAWVLERTRMSKFGAKQLLIIDDVTGRVNVPPAALSFDTWLTDVSKTRSMLSERSVDLDSIVDADFTDTDEVEVIMSMDAAGSGKVEAVIPSPSPSPAPDERRRPVCRADGTGRADTARMDGDVAVVPHPSRSGPGPGPVKRPRGRPRKHV